MPIRSGIRAALACAALAGLTTPAHTSQTAPPTTGRVDFSFQIRPLLSDRCFRCHGPDASKRKAKLRLDTREGAFKDIDLGWSIVKPGNPEKSELVRRIFSDFEDDMMPPPDSHLALSDAEKALLRRWVAEGADYKPHWSLIPVHEVAVPLGAASPIDGFVRARLVKEGLKPAPAGRARDPAAPPGAQPDGAPAHSSRDRCASRRSIAERLRARRGSLSGVAGLRRADGDGLARPRPLRGHLRLPGRLRSRHVAVPRLGHPRLQPEPALRPVPSLAACGRPPAQRDARPAHRHGVQPPPPPDERGRQHRGGVPHRVRRSIASTPSAPRCWG